MKVVTRKGIVIPHIIQVGEFYQCGGQSDVDSLGWAFTVYTPQYNSTFSFDSEKAAIIERDAIIADITEFWSEKEKTVAILGEISKGIQLVAKRTGCR